MIEFLKIMVIPMVEIWKESKTPLDYIVAFWITGLFTLFVVGWTSIVFAMITGQIDFDGLRFGLFDNPI